ncbi:hypothetical protein [Enterobacter sp. R1(2018)]|uniref:hypothetical protein n=1 Tax=Enterobacter sp. R1(2018) TaxID=2447891 RepID=UPI000EB4155E|nr:hypothetical protein [Enterobacter sp. R1(2018)]RKQ38413.1 hypothetical protein D8M09_17575 [Enterobacter sp. R1(2018)]
MNRGFASPAADYVERTLSITDLVGMNANKEVIETSSGYVIIDTSMSIENGCTLLISFCGQNQFAKIMGRSLITEDGEAIEGEAVEEVIVLGRVTHFIQRMYEYDSPVM